MRNKIINVVIVVAGWIGVFFLWKYTEHFVVEDNVIGLWFFLTDVFIGVIWLVQLAWTLAVLVV